MQVKEQKNVEGVIRYSGMQSFQVVALNPSLEELNNLGVTYIKEQPIYSTEEGKLRIDLWLRNSELNPELILKTSIFIENGEHISSTGKKRWLNDYLQNSWAIEVNDIYENAKMSWFSQNHNTRAARIGELELLTFFQKLMGLSLGSGTSVNPDKVVFNTTWEQIVSGNLKELRGYVNDSLKAGNGLTFLLGVKNTPEGKQYQQVYMNYFQSSKNKTTKGMQNALNDRTPDNFDYQGSLVFQVYTGTGSTVTPDNSAVHQDIPF
jgi:hypothetical protein